MKLKEFCECFKKDASQRSQVTGIFVGVIVLLILFIAMVWFIGDKNNRYKVTQEEIAKKTGVIEEYKLKEKEYKRQYSFLPQPVSMQGVDQVHNDLMRKSKELALSINSAATIPSASASEVGQEFEIGVQGSWENVAKFIEQFQRGSVLLSIRSLQLEAIKDEIKATIKYKVYFLPEG